MKLLRNIASKFKWAFEGLIYGLRFDRSIQTQVVITLVVLSFSFILNLSTNDFMFVIILCTIVLVTEVLNSAIEHLSDYVSDKEYSLKIKRVKDLAAAAVLVASICSCVVGIMIFYKYIF